MKGLLTLSADFFQRTASPEAGVAVNEDYAGRLAALLHEDPDFIGSLVEAQSQLTEDDIGLMSPSAWLAFVDLMRSTGHRPNDRLMTALYEHAFDPLLRYRMIEIAVTDPHVRELVNEGATRFEGIAGFPDNWLRSRMLATISGETRAGIVPPEARARLAIELVLILVQIGTGAAIEAAAALLRHAWESQGVVREGVRSVFDGLPADDAVAWLVRLGIMEPPLQT